MQQRIKSRILNLNMTVQESGAVIFEDGVEYSRAEVDTLKKTAPDVDDIKALHSIKGLFGGEIVHEPDPEGALMRERMLPTVLPPYVKPAPQEK